MAPKSIKELKSYRLCTIRLPMHPNEALLTLQNYDFLTICCIFPTGSSTGSTISQIKEPMFIIFFDLRRTGC